jgi:hypothetical protein
MSDNKLPDRVNKGFENTGSWGHATVTTDTSTISDIQNCNDNKNQHSISLVPISVTCIGLEEFGFPSSLAPSIRWGNGSWNMNGGWRQCDLHSWIEAEVG